MSEHETEAQLARFLAAYIEAALWSTNDESNEQGGDPLDNNYGPEDLAPETLEAMRVECVSFLSALTPDGVVVDRILASAPGPYWAQNAWSRAHAAERQAWNPIEHAGHDFWLTRCGHGCGFWDGDWPEPLASELAKLAKAAGERWLTVGDDGLIYQD